MIYLATIFIAIIMMFIEWLIPAQRLEKRSGWWLRAILLNSVQLALVFIAGTAWDRWLQSISLFKSETLFGFTGSIMFAYLTITFVYYWWHRIRHENSFLWRWIHQIHHSPRRIEIITSFYKHPLEIIINSILTSSILYVLLGLSPEAGAITVAITGVAELLYHWNIRTPYWIGFIFQRPESHRIHHQECWHRNNFSDLPIWDMLFGTFQNPRQLEHPCGFTGDKEYQFFAMLSGVDVHKRKS